MVSDRWSETKSFEVFTFVENKPKVPTAVGAIGQRLLVLAFGPITDVCNVKADS